MPVTTKTLNKDLVFPKAGHFMLQKFDANGILDPANFYLSSHGIVKSIKRATTITSNGLADGNSAYDAKEYATKEETILTISLSTYDPELEAFLKGIELKETASDIASALEFATIPDDGILVLSKKVKDANFKLFVKDKFGNIFAVATETPTTGQYSVAVTTDEAAITFAVADKGKEVFIVYDAKFTTVSKMEYAETPKLVPMQATIIGETSDYDEKQTYTTNIVIDKSTLNGGINPPDQTNDPTGGWEIALKTGKPRAGKKPVTIVFAK